MDPARLAAHYALEDAEMVLSPDQVQRAAVQNSGAGGALEADSEGGDGHPCLACTGGQKRSRLSKLLKAYAADEARNQSAALALEAYYHLAEARLQLRLIVQAVDLANKAVEKAESFRGKGLTFPEEITKLQRQASDTLADQFKLELLRARYTEQVRQAGDCHWKTCRISTVETFHVIEHCIDEGEAIGIGLKHRPDLNLLRAAIDNLDASTLPLVRKLLGATNPLLGDKVKGCIPMMDCLPRFCPCLASGEIEKVRQELAGLLTERERQAVSEIRQGVRRVETTAKLARLSQQRETLAAKRAAELETRAGKGLATDAELPPARRDHLSARGDVVRDAVAWELAGVELRRAQGLLVREVFAGCCEGQHSK